MEAYRSKRLQEIAGLLLLVVLAVVASGCGHSTSEAEENEEAGPTEPVPVEAATAKETTLRPALDLVGTIVAIPERTAAVSSRLGGWVENVAVVEGQAVGANQLLLQLDAHAAEADLLHAQATVEEKQAVLTRLKKGYLPQELEAARQDRERAQATMEGLKSEVDALQALLNRGEFSTVQYDTKVKAYKAAEAAYESARAHARLLEQGTRVEVVDEAAAQLKAAQASEKQADLAVKWCRITTPIKGVVARLAARQGQFFDRASTLATVIDLSEVFVQLRIPSHDYAQVEVGTKVDITVTALPGRTFHGHIARIAAEADPQTGSVDVFATVPNPDGSLRPGLGCQARVWLPEIANALAVPRAAIADNDGTTVVTLIRDGKAQEQPVQLGVETQNLVQIVKGLRPGDMVATAGGYGLPEGCPVKIVTSLSAGQKDHQ
jgi:multidrug efflux pump subunit AcrA (membrane-fusion protein)